MSRHLWLGALAPQELPMPPMRCDFPPPGTCFREVKRAPRIILPSRTPFEPGHAPLRIMTTLHFCDTHRYTFNVAHYWTGEIRTRAEAAARQKRPAGFRPDFDAAWCEMVLVTTPEYRGFLRNVGLLPRDTVQEFLEAQRTGGSGLGVA